MALPYRLRRSLEPLRQALHALATRFTYHAVCSLRGSKQVRFQSILIMAPHPDDEVLGLGGFVLQVLQAGGKVDLVFLTDGEKSGSSQDREEIKRVRIAQSERVASEWGLPLASIHRLHLRDSMVPHRGQPGFDEAVVELVQLLDDLGPEAVFATDALDYHQDHVACSEMATEALGLSAKKPELWFYWVWAWYRLVCPMQLHKIPLSKLCKIDISGQMAKKKELLDIYLKPLSPKGTPWGGCLPEAMLYPFTKPFEFVRKSLGVGKNRAVQ